jgi:hypothetical protein
MVEDFLQLLSIELGGFAYCVIFFFNFLNFWKQRFRLFVELLFDLVS